MVDNLLQGLSTTLIGMLIVFSGLLILIICISIMHRLLNRKEKAAPAEAPAVAVPVAPAPVQVPAEEEETDDGELIAAITAAIAAVWDQEQSGFVVRRVRRISNSPLSARLARDEQMYSHF